MKVLVTGGAGFIGSCLVNHLVTAWDCHVVVIDKLTYASNLSSLEELDKNQIKLYQKDIVNQAEIKRIIFDEEPDCIFHLAAESHVDRSIIGPSEFISTNIIGTYNLLECSLEYLSKLSNSKSQQFKFIHISTDEVFGDLGLSDRKFNENTAYAPSSPYSASKASSDHLVNAWHRTYNLPTIITNCSNNYGPFQNPEKFIPKIIINALNKKMIPVYGNGEQIRDWLFVNDHISALLEILSDGVIGESYNIGGNNEISNISVANEICKILNNTIKKTDKNFDHSSLIKFVSDRPGHDQKYAIDSSKLMSGTSWRPLENFSSGIKKTIDWYIKNENWWKNISSQDTQGVR